LKAALRAHRPSADLPVTTLRSQMAEAAAALPAPEGIAVRAVEVGGVAAESIVPATGGVRRTILYLHGGGYCTGSLAATRGLGGRLALAASARVVTLDYRLAPEHPFPAGRDDVLAAYRALLADGCADADLVVGGDSAGGGLTVSALVALREAGEPLPAAAFCLSPWADLRLSAPSIAANADADAIISVPLLHRFVDWYVAGSSVADPGVSPVLADLGGLPRLLVQVGDDECVVDDATRLAGRATAAGVPVELELWPDVVHVWHLLAPRFDAANRAIERIAAWLDEPTG
jgi:acetyl esterase/lipase